MRAEIRAQTPVNPGGLRLLYVTDHRLVLCHMAGPLYPPLQLLLFGGSMLVSDIDYRLATLSAAILLIVIISVTRCKFPFRRIDRILPLAEIEAMAPSSSQDAGNVVLWLRDGATWVLCCPLTAWFIGAPNVVREFGCLRKVLRELISGYGPAL